MNEWLKHCESPNIEPYGKGKSTYKSFHSSTERKSFSEVVKKTFFSLSAIFASQWKNLKEKSIFLWKFPFLIQNENFVTPQLILCKIIPLNELIPHSKKKFFKPKEKEKGKLLVKKARLKGLNKIFSEIKLIFRLNCIFSLKLKTCLPLHFFIIFILKLNIKINKKLFFPIRMCQNKTFSTM